MKIVFDTIPFVVLDHGVSYLVAYLTVVGSREEISFWSFFLTFLGIFYLEIVMCELLEASWCKESWWLGGF
jgi:hypothetical protein